MQAGQTYGRYADEILEGRQAESQDTRGSVNESVASPTPANKDPGDEVIRALDFDGDLSIMNENEDDQTKDEATLDTIQTKTIENELQETQKTKRVVQRVKVISQ